MTGHERPVTFPPTMDGSRNSSTMAIMASCAQADYANMHVQEQDEYDLNKMYDILLKEYFPCTTKIRYLETDRQECMRDVRYQFDARGWRMNIMI